LRACQRRSGRDCESSVSNKCPACVCHDQLTPTRGSRRKTAAIILILPRKYRTFIELTLDVNAGCGARTRVSEKHLLY
jgi:hypothetical protein